MQLKLDSLLKTLHDETRPSDDSLERSGSADVSSSSESISDEVASPRAAASPPIQLQAPPNIRGRRVIEIFLTIENFVRIWTEQYLASFFAFSCQNSVFIKMREFQAFISN